MDAPLKEDVLRLENTLAKFIQATDAHFWIIDDSLWCNQISINNLEHQIGEIYDLLSKKQKEYEWSLQVPFGNDGAMRTIDEVEKTKNVDLDFEKKVEELHFENNDYLNE